MVGFTIGFIAGALWWASVQRLWAFYAEDWRSLPVSGSHSAGSQTNNRKDVGAWR